MVEFVRATVTFQSGSCFVKNPIPLEMVPITALPVCAITFPHVTARPFLLPSKLLIYKMAVACIF
jgi:hypothetical protein